MRRPAECCHSRVGRMNCQLPSEAKGAWVRGMQPCILAHLPSPPWGVWDAARTQPRRHGTPTSPAFTLIEVVLAIAIAIGILVVVLYFYQQAADLRTQLLLEAERVSTVRLLLDRLTADLRSARSDFNSGLGLSGDSSSIRFVKAELPSRSAWAGGQLGRALAAETDLKQISYGVTSSQEGTNLVITGLVRMEQPCVEPRPLPEAKGASLGSGEAQPEVPRGPEPLTEVIRFLRFRYWDGSNWQDSWNAIELPQGVEVSLGGPPLPESLIPEEYPYELFRRVIYLPGQGVSNGGVDFFDLLEEAAPSTEETP